MRPVFIGGCDRSGTTLLGSILGAHSRCLCIPEMPFKFRLQRALDRNEGNVSKVFSRVMNDWRFQIWGLDLDPEAFVWETPSARAIIEQIVNEYGKHIGHSTPAIWLDHTPQNLLHTQMLLEQFPEARIIHIVRDGRAVASSLMRADWGPNTSEKAAHFWCESLARGFAAEMMRGPERVMRVRYEDLVGDTEATLEQLCSHLGIDFEPGMSQRTSFMAPKYTAENHGLVGSVPDPSRINSWASSLTPRQIEIFESVAGDLLRYLGYPIQYGIMAKSISRSERFASGVYDLYRKVGNWRHARRRIRMGTATGAQNLPGGRHE